MFYLDPVSNPRSKQQRFGDKNGKNSLVSKNNFWFSCKLLTKTIIVFFPSATFFSEITEPMRKIKIRINDL